MRVRFWGVRGSYPVPGSTTNRVGGNTSCVQVCLSEGAPLIIDAGTGIRRLGQELTNGSGRGVVDVHLLISHTHWDHIQGIPFFAPLYRRGNRVHFYARQREVHLQTIFSSQSQKPYFPVSLAEVAAEVSYTELVEGQRFRIGGAEVRCTRLNHPFIAIGYRVDAEGGSLAYVSDTAPFDHILFGQQYVAGAADLSAPLPEEDAASLRAIRDGVVDLCRGCDLVIYDTMFRMSEYMARPHWGHSCPEHALAIAEAAQVKSLALFHHAPDRTDEEVEQDCAEARARARCDVFAACEGMVVEVGDGAHRRAG